MAESDRKIPSKETLNYLVTGLKKYHPDAYFEKASLIASSRYELVNKGRDSKGRDSFDENLRKIFEEKFDIEDIVKKVKVWEAYYYTLENSLEEKPKEPAETVPRNIDEIVEKYEKGLEQKRISALELERQNKELQKQLEEIARTNRGENAKFKRSPTETKVIETKPIGVGSELPKHSQLPPSPEPNGPGIILEVAKKVNLNPAGKIALSFAKLPFFLSGPSMADASLAGQETATAQHLLFMQGLTSSTFKSTIKPKALSLGISPSQIDKLVNEIARQEKVFPELFRTINSSYKIQSILVKAGAPQATSGQLFLGQSGGGSLVMPQRGFFGNIFGRIGQQLFGKVVKKGINSALAKTGFKVVETATELAGPEGWIATAALWLTEKVAEKTIPFIQKYSRYAIAIPIAIGGFFVQGALGAGMVGGAAAIAFYPSGGLSAIGQGVGNFFRLVFLNLFLPSIALPIVVSLLGMTLLIALIIFIINSGAYVVPPSPSFVAGEVQSPYIEVTKTPNPPGPFENSDVEGKTLTITYTIEVTAKKETLSNIKINYDCNVIKEGSPIKCPDPHPNIPTTSGSEGSSDNNIPPIISPVSGSYKFIYTQDIDSRYKDSLIVDTITVTADVTQKAGNQSAASASVKIGSPPDQCPEGWPIALPQKGSSQLPITQGPDGSYSHLNAEAIDIGTSYKTGFIVTARHSGTVITAEGRDTYPYGKHIEIASVCEGKPFFSRYAHLSIVSVQKGQAVGLGQVIGESGNTGNSSGPHLHYEFRGDSGRKGPSPNNPPYMAPIYIPKTVPYRCSGSCGSLP